MKLCTLVSILLTLLLAIFGTSAASAGELTITVTDIRAATGTIQVSVANSEAAWNNQAKPIAGKKVAVTDKQVVLHFTLPAGTYAVQVMHDENGNDKLDTNFVGMPIEGYGFSNNPTGLRKAHYDEARFEVGEKPAVVAIRLR